MNIGFIGLGFQGKPLARNILDDGHSLTVFDVLEEPVTELAAVGAHAAGSPEELAAGCDVVFICVINDAQVLDVLNGDAGVLKGIRPGSTVVVHSTILPDTVRLAAELVEAKGGSLVDAPVSGSAKGAEERTMSYMVGGSTEAIDRCLPIFRQSGPTITVTGGVGTATAAKIAHQLVCCMNMMAVHEGLALGEAAGVSREALLEAFNGGFAQSRAGDMWPDLDLYPRAFPIFYKDLKAVLDLAHQEGVRVPGAALVQQLLAEVLPRISKEEL